MLSRDSVEAPQGPGHNVTAGKWGSGKEISKLLVVFGVRSAEITFLEVTLDMSFFV